QFMQDHTQTKNIAAAIDNMSLAPDLLGGHIRQAAGKSALLLRLILFSDSQTEVRDTRLPVWIQKNIFRLDVPMDQALQVSIMKSMSDLGHHSCSLVCC